jgi:hypothetical protein
VRPLRYTLYRAIATLARIPKVGIMFTSIGLPQFGLIVLVLIIFIVYTQRHRF